MGDDGYNGLETFMDDARDGLDNLVTDPVGTVRRTVSTVAGHPGQFVDEVGETLQELMIDEVTIDGILKSLATSEDELPTELAEMPTTAFGNLPKGAELGHHARLARDYLTLSMAEMMTTLGLYVEGVQLFRQGSNVSDTHAAQDLDRIRAIVDSAAGTNQSQGRHHGRDDR